MPIHEFYCPDNHTIYQFYAKTLAQGRTIPPCPDNPRFRMVKMMSSFAVTSGGRKTEDAGRDVGTGDPGAGDTAEDARMEAAMGAMEKEFSNVDENDPRAMGRMMRRMAELSGERIDGEMEEVVRKLEEGADPDELESQLGGEAPCHMEDPIAPESASDQPREALRRFRARRARAAARDPKLHDYP